ncbi:hypothetical protein Tco_0461680, partial [Tanacetum coccineum]
NTIKKIKDTDAYQFKLDKKKFSIDTEVFHEILQICPRLPNQDFVEPPSDKEMVPLIKDLGYTGKCISGKSIGLDKLREDTPKKARKFKKIASLLKKQTLVLEEPAKKPKRAKHPEPVKKSAPAKKDVSFKKPLRKQLTGVQIRDTLDVSVSNKKAPATTNKSKGIDLLSKAALLEDVQMKKGESVDNDDSNKDDNDDGNNDANDDERTESDDDLKDNDNEEEYEDEYVRTLVNYESTDDENEHVNAEEYDCINEELYKDVYVKLKDVEHREEGKGYAEKTDVGHDDVTQETTYDQVKDDTHVTVIVAYVT